MFLLAPGIGGVGVSSVLHRSISETSPSDASCSSLKIFSFLSMAARSSPTPAFVLLDSEGAARWINIVFGTPIFSISGVCS